MGPTLKSAALALAVLITGSVLWGFWLVIGVIYAERSTHRAEQAVFAITGVTALAFLFGSIAVYRGARKFGASVPGRWVVTLVYLGAASFETFALFFFTALAFNR